MTAKLIMFMILLIRIGRKPIFFLSVILLFHSCGLFMWDEEYDYYYKIHIRNNTEDTLIVVFNDSVVNKSIYDYTIYPYNTVDLNYGRNINEGEDIRKRVLSDGKHNLYEEVNVFRNDSLTIKWEGPVFHSDSIHHFYNYNSWEHWLIDEYEGIVQFTIYESDFE
jgi:hypothetical protein